MPSACLVLCAGFGNPGHAFHNPQPAEVGQDVGVFGQGKRFVLDAGFQERHGFPIPCFRNHHFPDIALAVLLAAGFGQGAAIAPCIKRNAGKTRQGIENGE